MLCKLFYVENAHTSERTIVRGVPFALAGLAFERKESNLLYIPETGPRGGCVTRNEARLCHCVLCDVQYLKILDNATIEYSQSARHTAANVYAQTAMPTAYTLYGQCSNRVFTKRTTDCHTTNATIEYVLSARLTATRRGNDEHVHMRGRELLPLDGPSLGIHQVLHPPRH